MIEYEGERKKGSPLGVLVQAGLVLVPPGRTIIWESCPGLPFPPGGWGGRAGLPVISSSHKGQTTERSLPRINGQRPSCSTSPPREKDRTGEVYEAGSMPDLFQGQIFGKEREWIHLTPCLVACIGGGAMGLGGKKVGIDS